MTIFALFLIASGFAAILRATTIARQNLELIEGRGEEIYFEQRRAAQAYRHPTNPRNVKIGGWVFVAIGFVLLLNSTVLHWGVSD
jgi:hypothetical protein